MASMPKSFKIFILYQMIKGNKVIRLTALLLTDVAYHTGFYFIFSLMKDTRVLPRRIVSLESQTHKDCILEFQLETSQVPNLFTLVTSDLYATSSSKLLPLDCDYYYIPTNRIYMDGQ